ncbi:MAG TPA: Wzz/FepE/Etk N-terminal domain-containing protein [Gemmatimonadales bacterium]
MTAHTRESTPAFRSERGGPEVEVSFLAIANVLLRYRRLVIGAALLVFALVVGITLVLPRSYTSRSSFMPQTRSQTGSLSGLAAQFGFTLPLSATDGGQSPAFYADLVKSRSILGGVVDSQFEYQGDQGPVKGTLVDFYKSKGKTPALRRDAAIRKLEDDVEATTVQKTGMVNLAVTVRQPALALEINQRLLDLINQFNLRTRQSQASQERRFTEQRLAEVRQDLRAAEDRLQQFLQRNRDIRNSPDLTFQADRLQREVTMQQQVFTTLAQAYEQAKIEEVRDTPVITVVERPEAPVRPDRRGLIGKGLLGLLLGLVIGAGLAFGKSFAANSDRLTTSEAAEFAVLRRQAAGELLRPWRPLAELLRLRRQRGTNL